MSPSLETGTASPQDLSPLSRLLGRCYFTDATPLEATLSGQVGVENIRVLRSPAGLLGGLVLLPCGQFFGGREVPAAGLGWVAVAPEARGQGASTRLLRDVLSELRGRQLALATLFPSSVRVYEKVGFGRAGLRLRYRVPMELMPSPDRSARMERFELEVPPEVERLQATRARGTAGNMARGHRLLWSRGLCSAETGGQRYLLRREGEVRGYLAYRPETDAEGRHRLRVTDLVSAGPAAAAGLLGFLGTHRSLAPSFEFDGAPVDPFLAMLAEQGARVVDRIEWMTRILDVKQALEARGYPAGLAGSVALEIDDPLFEANRGRFVLRVEGGKGVVEPGGKGKLRLPVHALSALYTGHLSATALAAVGLVAGPEPSLSRADLIFSGPAPWMPDHF